LKRPVKKPLIAVVMVVIILITVYYYVTSLRNTGGSVNASIVVTLNFGKDLILQRSLTVPMGTNALEALKMVAEVETIYGGGFVSSINGIRSTYPSMRFDWFFYVNGFLAKEGALSYVLFDGDLIQWDYHSWESNIMVNAVLGGYPKCFTNGYGGRVAETTIVFESTFASEASELRESLRRYGVDAATLSVDEVPDHVKSRSNMVILAKSNNEFVAELNKIHKRIGFYAFFNGGRLIQCDSAGNPYREYDEAGVILVTQNIWNPKGMMACENIIMLLSGTDERSVKKCVQVLLEDSPRYGYAFSLIVARNETVMVP